MASNDFKYLKREVLRFRKELLPKDFDPTGVYRKAKMVQTRTRSFLLLCHAGIEDYLETRAKQIARRSEALWNVRRISRPMAFLIGYNRVKFSATEKGFCPIAEMEREAKSLFQDYYAELKENHGIKSKNVFQMYLKIGFELDWFGSVLIPDLESFGEDRGKLAHYHSKIVSFLDPEIEWLRIQKILSELEVFDKRVQEYLKSIK